MIKAMCNLRYVCVISGSVIFLLGSDMISGTPVIDIKPYIPQYDSPWNHCTCLSGTANMKQTETQASSDDMSVNAVELSSPLNMSDVKWKNTGCVGCENVLLSTAASDETASACQNTMKCDVSVAEWITRSAQCKLSVVFTERAEQQLQQFDSVSPDANFRLRHLANAAELRSALTAVLQADPRSVYRRKRGRNQLYFVTVDIAHVTCWFDFDTVEVLKLQSSELMLQNTNI